MESLPDQFANKNCQKTKKLGLLSHLIAPFLVLFFKYISYQTISNCDLYCPNNFCWKISFIFCFFHTYTMKHDEIISVISTTKLKARVTDEPESSSLSRTPVQILCPPWSIHWSPSTHMTPWSNPSSFLRSVSQYSPLYMPMWNVEHFFRCPQLKHQMRKIVMPLLRGRMLFGPATFHDVIFVVNLEW